MRRDQLSEVDRIKYDSLVDEMMGVIEKKCNAIKEETQHFDGIKTQIYKEVTNKYLPKLQKILEGR